MNWQAGWKPHTDGTADDAFVREFLREASAGHVLANVRLRTIGTNDADNVLFELLDGSGRFAAVQLTFNRESNPRWPDTNLYDNWEHFEREGEGFLTARRRAYKHPLRRTGRAEWSMQIPERLGPRPAVQC